MSSNQENSIKLLEHGIKPSVQRLAILEYINTHRTHPTVDEIFNNLSEAIPTLSKTTIYNTLSMFADDGLVNVINIDEKNVHYDGYTTPHAHFRCVRCHQIFDLPNPELEPPILDQFEILETHIYYKGICNKCKNNN